MTDDVQHDVDAQLEEWGASPDEVERAREKGLLGLLAVAQAAFPGRPRYTAPEIAAKAGMEPDTAARYWRALGFPDANDDERIFTDADVEALATVSTMIEVGLTDIDVSIQMTRVVGSSLARIAEAFVTSTGGVTRPEEVADLLALTAASALETQARLLEYVWRRHLQAAARRVLESEGAGLLGDRPAVELAVGFADLVGFTAMAQQVDNTELAHIVGRFEALAFDQVAIHGGRVAKMIGDEVMFVVDSAAAAVDIALDLAEIYAGDDVLSDVRVGLACGPVLAREGDYYGPVVNLASRIVNIAMPGSVVVAESVRDLLEGDARYRLRSLRTRSLKDIGRVRLWRVRRGDD